MTLTGRGLFPLILGIVLAGAGVAAAQDPPAQTKPPSGAPGQRAGGQGTAVADAPENPRTTYALVNALDQYALIEARRALQLSEDQYSQFVPRLRALQQTQRRLQQTRRGIVQDLRRLAGPRATGSPDEGAIRERLTALREHDERAAAELRAAHAALDEVLDARQQARFRLFEENIEARKLELLVRARARAGRGGS
jgi:hypothetical protein